jgi:hypothetical protein
MIYDTDTYKKLWHFHAFIHSLFPCRILQTKWQFSSYDAPGISGQKNCLINKYSQSSPLKFSPGPNSTNDQEDVKFFVTITLVFCQHFDKRRFENSF